MRRLIVRFENKNDLDKLSNKINIELTRLTTQVNMDSSEVKNRKNIKGIPKMKNIEWKKYWYNMPEYNLTFPDESYVKIEFLFPDNYNSKKISDIFEQNITEKTLSIWYPKLVHGKDRDIRVVGGENPEYPVYVISKGREWLGISHTSTRLSQMGVYHYLVVEPQEYNKYLDKFANKFVKIIKMDLKYKHNYDCFSELGNKESTGPGAVRNFCWEHSIKNGFAWHWVLDDNIEGFNRYWRGHRIICRTGEVFRSCERFVNRFENIAIAGLNYSKFCDSGSRRPPYVLNTRIYSMLLIRNDIDYRWRGRYNEDTDLSLRVLKDNWCTVQFNLFLGEKRTTQAKKGGNSDEFYFKEGTLPKSEMLVDMHPDLAKLVYKFNRWHHYVDYSVFKQNLKLKNDICKDVINENGMMILRIPREECNSDKDNSEYITYNIHKYKNIGESNLYL